MATVQSGEGTEKKPTPKGKAKPATKTKAAPARGMRGFSPEEKITILQKENPRREGSEKHKMYELARKSATVAVYHRAGGDMGALRHCVTRRWIKVS